MSETKRLKAYDLMKLAAENPQECEGRMYRVVEWSGMLSPITKERYEECVVMNGGMKSSTANGLLFSEGGIT